MSTEPDSPIVPRRPAGTWQSGAKFAVLLTAFAATRLWLIDSSDLIARDGTLYVHIAQTFSSDPVQTVRSATVHPGYPVLLWAVHGVMEGQDSSDVEGWDRAGRTISFVAALGATVGLWLWSRLLIGPSAAFIGALLFTLGRKWSALGADVLSDSLAVCLQVWALLAGLAVLRRLMCGRRSAVLWAVAAGALVGLAYLVRFEPIVLVGALAGTWAVCSYRQGRNWRLGLACIGVFGATFIATVLPFVVTIGHFTTKQTHLDQLLSAGGHSGAFAGLALAVADSQTDWTGLVDKFFEAQHPLLGFLTLTCLLGWGLARRFPLVRRLLPLPMAAREPALILLAVCLLLVPLMAVRLGGMGDLSGRYLMLPALLSSPLAGAAVLALTEAAVSLMVRGVRGEGIIQRRRGWAVAAVTAALAAGLTAHALRPLHEGSAYRQAGLFLRERASDKSFLLTDEAWALHYSGWPGRANLSWMPQWLELGRHRLSFLPTLVRQYRPSHLLLSQRLVQRDFPWLEHAESQSTSCLAERGVGEAISSVCQAGPGSVGLVLDRSGGGFLLQDSAGRLTKSAAFDLPEGCVLTGLGDLDGDGRDELIVQGGAGGQQVRAMRSDGVGWKAGEVLLEKVEDGWQCVGAGRFTGRDQPGLLLLGSPERRLRIVAPAGRPATDLELGSLGRIATVCGIGDLDLDGRDDVILRLVTPTAHRIFVWLVRQDGTKLSRFVVENAPLEWDCIGWGDVNGDHLKDMLWRRRADGRVDAWHMAGLWRLHDFVPAGEFPSRRGRADETLRLYEVRPGPPLP
ncbi:MAG: FG-GAP repeat protein [Planctomycetes bacterium ADurb.Bin126]|nr:MAG: FG-GAP repeat protein [Planctomycetes bacterium ADurb.Bin126]HOD80977.1 glycosyltransferase family 39 protein [Phycisphaerae bacterium]HQL73342.1 glycosyltransferase family 39 protein [Phycisphaerae bacterium]